MLHGDAPQRVFFGGDDARQMWTWDCRFPHPRGAFDTFGDEATWSECVAELAEHTERYHGDRGSHECPMCGLDVQNRREDPERTDPCAECLVRLRERFL